MTYAETIKVLREALDQIREATFAEFQQEMDPRKGFNVLTDACPTCRRASTISHLKDRWALIQAIASETLRETE